MKSGILSTLVLLIAGTSFLWGNSTDSRRNYKIFVDKNGVMRRSDTKEEVSYFGTNYTLPFAHAYRAVGKEGVDRKEAIRKDVYHMKRLGFNGFRLHLWDVEISDSAGNLLQNDHLDLLDYLISQLEKEGIDIILTAQTNFGNGYPEKNIDTGAFSYAYDKCEIHSNKTAQEIQANYLTQLASHINPYTGSSYADDNAIIAMEINNEPCHTDSRKEVTAYINKMVKALKKGGFNKPILYNVSHNPDVTEAYYDADIQGTTYQWYPTGLVAGHQRKGNFLPYVDQYPIPWKDSIKNYDRMARVVYEFDPGDVLYSHLYPAIVRTFRKEGFQWITQFAYDPIDIAKYNTEYQTHFLNLAYTPGKAISMMIAGEAAAKIPRGADYGIFPADTVFGDFTVSYKNDLSVYNSGDKFYNSNNTDIRPKNPASLTNIAGVGSSPLVDYDGTGAYFIDSVSPGVWRLEVMPDVVLVSDPFEKPSPKKEIARIFYSERPYTIKLPQLGQQYYYTGINEGNERKGRASSGSFEVYPGVYLLSPNKESLDAFISDKLPEDEGLRAYVAPEANGSNSIVKYNAPTYFEKYGDLTVTADVIGNGNPEEVLIYPGYVSFWNDHNNIIPMKKTEGNSYTAVIPGDQTGYDEIFGFNIVVKENGKYYTWPQNIEGTPLDWDYFEYDTYKTKKLDTKEPIVLLSPVEKDKNLDMIMLPEWGRFNFQTMKKAPVGNDAYRITLTPENTGELVIRRYVGDELKDAPFLGNKEKIVVKAWPGVIMEDMEIELVNRNGSTYSAPILPEYANKPNDTKLHSDNPEGIEYHVPLSQFEQTETVIIPDAFPAFLPKKVKTAEQPFTTEDIEFVQLSIPVIKGEPLELLLEGLWLQ